MIAQRILKDEESGPGDRRPIRIDGLPDQAGIAAVLRRAFAAGNQRDTDSEFADLLDRIH